MTSLWITALACGLLVTAWLASARDRQHFVARRNLRAKMRLFSRDCVVSADGQDALALDAKSRQILLASHGGAKQEVLSYDKLLGVELLEDGRLITRICRKPGQADPDRPGEMIPVHQDGRACGAGRVRSIVLGVTLDEAGQARQDIALLDVSGRGLSPENGRYCQLRSQADRWCAMLQVAIMREGGR
jgi:hypothetical protein